MDVMLREDKVTPDMVGRIARKLVTFHDSFDHFARKFELEVAGYAVAKPGDAIAFGEYRMTVKDVYYIGGFGEMGWVSRNEYSTAG